MTHIRGLRSIGAIGPDEAAHIKAERDKLKAINADLLAALKDIIPRFERCIIVGGTTEEFAKIATKAARAVVAKADPAAPSK